MDMKISAGEHVNVLKSSPKVLINGIYGRKIILRTKDVSGTSVMRDGSEESAETELKLLGVKRLRRVTAVER